MRLFAIPINRKMTHCGYFAIKNRGIVRFLRLKIAIKESLQGLVATLVRSQLTGD